MMNRCHCPNSSPTDRPSLTMVSGSKSSPVSSRGMHSLGDDRRRLWQALRLSLRATLSTREPRLVTTIRSASLLAAVIVIGASAPAAGATDCVGRPDLQAAQDGHWRYWVDRPSHRKCWYLERQSPSA